MVESKSSKPEANKENADPAKEMEVDEEEEEDETAPSKVFTIESELLLLHFLWCVLLG